MRTYLAILRGINVSGQKKIKMADLRDLLTKAGLQNVETYIQSGNIRFDGKGSDAREYAQLIQNTLLDHYGWQVPTIVFSGDYLKQVIDRNAFPEAAEKEPNRMGVVFLDQGPAADKVAAMAGVEYPEEYYQIDGQHVYYHAPNGFGRAKMTNNIWEKKLGVTATTRNWKTVLKLWEMLD